MYVRVYTRIWRVRSLIWRLFEMRFLSVHLKVPPVDLFTLNLLWRKAKMLQQTVAKYE